LVVDKIETKVGTSLRIGREIEGGSQEISAIELIQAEAGDVDITKEDVLVSVGRGIGDKGEHRDDRSALLPRLDPGVHLFVEDLQRQ